MKRFLSWLTLAGCYIVFCLLAGLDVLLLNYIFDLYGELSAFLKLVILLFGGSFVVGLAFAPLYYGIPLTFAASEAVCPSKRGDRYLVFGIYILITCVLEMVLSFVLRDILIFIYGIALILYGRNHAMED